MKFKQTSIELKTQRSRVNSFITNTSINRDVLILNKPFLTNKTVDCSYNSKSVTKFLPSKSFNPSLNSVPYLKTTFKYPLQVLLFASKAADNTAFILTNSKNVVLIQWNFFFLSCFFLISKKIQIESFLSPLCVYRTFSYLIASK